MFRADVIGFLIACRGGRVQLQDLARPEDVLAKIQQAVLGHYKDMEDALEHELCAREEYFQCKRDTDDFALMAAAREIRLPPPLGISQLCAMPAGTICVVAADDLDTSKDDMTSLKMQEFLASNGGIQLIAVQKTVTEEAAYLQYPSIAKNKLPLLAWAKILARSKVHRIAHLAVLVDESYNCRVYSQMQTQEKLAFRDIAAVLNVLITSDVSGMLETCLSMRLNVCQPRPEDSAAVKVSGWQAWAAAFAFAFAFAFGFAFA